MKVFVSGSLIKISTITMWVSHTQTSSPSFIYMLSNATLGSAASLSPIWSRSLDLSLSLSSDYAHIFVSVRAITSDCVNLCKIEKGSLFTHFCSKKTHISWGKIVHLCTIATVAVHICTATVACAYHILFFFSLSPSLLLSIPLTLNSFVFSIGLFFSLSLWLSILLFSQSDQNGKHSQLSLSLISFL